MNLDFVLTRRGEEGLEVKMMGGRAGGLAGARLTTVPAFSWPSVSQALASSLTLLSPQSTPCLRSLAGSSFTGPAGLLPPWRPCWALPADLALSGCRAERTPGPRRLSTERGLKAWLDLASWWLDLAW